MAPVRVLFLGTGDAFSAGGRNQSGCLVRGTHMSVLLDCGATTLASMKRLGVRASEVDAVLITHFHGDHFSGLPFLFLDSIYSEPRRRPLGIAGPPGIRQRVESLFRDTYRDTAAAPMPFALDYSELQPGQSTRIREAVIEPIPVPHQEGEIALALRLNLDGRSILYSGDSGWTEELVSYSMGTDLFICECSFFETRQSSHLDFPRIAQNRGRFGTRRLVLTHLGAEPLAHEAEIDIDLAQDGMVLEL